MLSNRPSKRAIERPCKRCGSYFWTEQKQIKRGKGVYCSRKCGAQAVAESRKKLPNVFCSKCHKKIYRKEGRIKRSKTNMFFCSIKCLNTTPKTKETKAKISATTAVSIKAINARKAAGIKLRREKIPNRLCIHCSVKFFSYNNMRKFCSNKCRYDSGTVGGYRQGSGHKNIKRGYYKNIWCASSWELAWLLYVTSQGQVVERNKDTFEYVGIDGKKHTYLPDFKTGKSYVEIKGRYYDNVKEKLNAVPNIILIDKIGMKPILRWVTKEYGKNFSEMLKK
jgi:hypothetical protein